MEALSLLAFGEEEFLAALAMASSEAFFNKLLVDRGHGLFMCSKPMFKYRKAKQDLMVVVTPRGMLLEKLAHRSGIKVLIDLGAAIEKHIRHPVIDNSPEPIIHYITGKTPFGSS